MNDTKGRELVKCVAGFLLAIAVVLGAIFGFDVDVKVDGTEILGDTIAPDESTQVPEDVGNVEDAEDETLDSATPETPETPETPSDTPQDDTSADSTQTEGQDPSVENPDSTTTTEGDENNA